MGRGQPDRGVSLNTAVVWHEICASDMGQISRVGLEHLPNEIFPLASSVTGTGSKNKILTQLKSMVKVPLTSVEQGHCL